MTDNRKANKQITFSSFMSVDYANDYILQTTPYDKQIYDAAKALREADFVLIGLGAGMSAAAGAEYGGKFFEEHFAEFQRIYGKGPYMQDTYSAGFYPFPDQEHFWGMWSKLALVGGPDLDVTPLHKTLLKALEGKKLFVLSTNVDRQFEKSGLPEAQVFNTQGSYWEIQCRRACHEKVYDAVERFREMDAARVDGAIPTELVPRCPVCGGPMAMHLRIDEFFVEDEKWHAAERRFGEFLTEAVQGNLTLLELGVGFNTPTIIRFPFEKLTRERENVRLVRLNRSKAMVPASLGHRAIGIQSDMAKSIQDIAAELTGNEG